eukprot:CAMPEP_0181505932 /NCGR_PEP_ID=MMETSP1110-20121109/58322_1 /TAXON_ID=174948 /ORGANISM="Symbiodinium sp., Strain CCMP421" /LENGTH=59 /DNA_ID=CAMNT_0023634951 /DNA_START=125 /DNA_END=304 /DNA_ORIENTATION=-
MPVSPVSKFRTKNGRTLPSFRSSWSALAPLAPRLKARGISTGGSSPSCGTGVGGARGTA